MVTSWPLIGRQEELSVIEHALEDGQYRGLLLAGASGVGKTRLAREALAAAEAAGCDTNWAVASPTVAGIPFGALAHLLPPAEPNSTHLQVLQQAGRWITERAAGRRVVLGIDDAHVLDDASAALLFHLVIDGIAFVVATVRTGEPAPGPVTALWKEGVAERLEIQALARAEVGQLIEAALGGPVEGLTKQRLWQLSRGNILYLRELVRGGRQAGDLACSEGTWRWPGPVSAPPQLAELIQVRIGAMPSALRDLGELVAFGEPLALAVLTRAGGSAADVETAERAGLLATEEVGPDLRVRLAHPLFGEVIRAQTPRIRRRTVHATLVEAVGLAGPADHLPSEDAVRIAVWHLEAGTQPDPGLLVAAADWALAALDYQLAERLCRAAGEAGTNWPAERLLAQALVGLGQAGSAEELLAGQFARARTGAERAEIGSVRALNLYWGLCQPERARAVLDEAADRIAESAHRASLAAMRGRFLLHDGWCRQTLAVLDPVLADPDVAHQVMLDAMATATMALIACGRYDDAVALAARGLRLPRPAAGDGWRTGAGRTGRGPGHCVPVERAVRGGGGAGRIGVPASPGFQVTAQRRAVGPGTRPAGRGQGRDEPGRGVAEGNHRHPGRTGPAAPLPGVHRPVRVGHARSGGRADRRSGGWPGRARSGGGTGRAARPGPGGQAWRRSRLGGRRAGRDSRSGRSGPGRRRRGPPAGPAGLRADRLA